MGKKRTPRASKKKPIERDLLTEDVAVEPVKARRNIETGEVQTVIPRGPRSKEWQYGTKDDSGFHPDGSIVGSDAPNTHTASSGVTMTITKSRKNVGTMDSAIKAIVEREIAAETKAAVNSSLNKIKDKLFARISEAFEEVEKEL